MPYIKRMGHYLEVASCRAYLGLEQQQKFLFCKDVLSQFNSKNCRASYKSFLESDSEIILKDGFPIVGSKSFEDSIKNVYFKDHEVHADIPESKKLAKSTLPGFEHVLKTISRYYNVSEKDLINRTANGLAQNVFIFLVVFICNLTLKEVSAKISNLTPANVSRIYNKVFKQIKRDCILKADVDEIIHGVMLDMWH